MGPNRSGLEINRRLRPYRARLGELGKKVAEHRGLCAGCRTKLGTYAIEAKEALEDAGGDPALRVAPDVARNKVLQAIDISWVDDWHLIERWAMQGKG